MELRATFLSTLLILCSFTTLLLILTENPVEALPLSTSSRWIVDEKGQRVKLACVNWASHLEVMVAEGLSKQPVDAISKWIVSSGFNCVRFTWPLFLFTNDTLGNTTVRHSLLSLGLNESLSGIQVNNPSIVDLPLIKTFQAVVANLGENNLMVILDNHISKPSWCCSNLDGNGFFGDQYFNPDLWIKGLTRVANLFNGVPNVVGMSLRNELRGPKQNVDDWYKYMQRGAEAVHAANENVLVILSGLSFDKDLSFLRKRPLNVSFSGKIVFEVHWYGFSDGQDWRSGNQNQVCGRVVDNVMKMSGFLLGQEYPLFVSEFGMDQRGINVNDNRYISCFLGVVAELDLDWALWTMVGSYYLREGVVGLDETYGALNYNWCEARNSSLLQRFSAVQYPLQGPGLEESNLHKVIFHPSTGLCVLRKSLFEPLRLGPCKESEAWKYKADETLSLQGTYFCIQADEIGKPAKLGVTCTGSNSKWEMISDSKMQLSSTTSNGSVGCLDVDSNNIIVVNTCKCLSRHSDCEAESQWFKLINSTRGSTTSKPYSPIYSGIWNLIKQKFMGIINLVMQ